MGIVKVGHIHEIKSARKLKMSSYLIFTVPLAPVNKIILTGELRLNVNGGPAL